MGPEIVVPAIRSWRGEAFNQVPDSDNRIHSDELAREYGFTGALVPGVTVSAYLIQPAVTAWGLHWLERGAAHATIKSPLYDEHEFMVEVEQQGPEDRYHAQLFSDDRLCAISEVWLPEALDVEPEYQNHEVMADAWQAPAANREVMEQLRQQGCPAKTFLWSAQHEMAAYLRRQSDMPVLLRTQALADNNRNESGYANMSFLLGCANRHFAAVASMSPWIHLEIRAQNFQAVPLNTALISEMTITDLFNKKGHEFADCVFSLFMADSKRCVCSIQQRAIYKMRVGQPSQ
ncbi:hypothetical protein [Pseudohongiella sp.]|uniref:MaoC-like domain-containing protein n=1 Tax=marine sediment metagenome TaxID=412755 RepID=A0A0F9XIU2_9ZZZZ|nr:hypothetical protein [Pseudohongiella sp.]HDZ08860.1 hypothetical protein [Pseudohongiella sp.]HEA62837.1 hypothetical protein [Pseudohongiella sp.]